MDYVMWRVKSLVDAELQILNLLGLSAIERRTWQDLSRSDDEGNFVTRSLLSFAIVHYTHLGLLPNLDNTTFHSQASAFSIPRPTWRITVKTKHATNCADAAIKILATSILPSPSCEPIIYHDQAKTVTRTKTGCRVLGPLKSSVTLNDNSLFIMTNSFTRPDEKCTLDDDFVEKNGSLLIRLQQGSATTSCGNIGARVNKTRLTEQSLATVSQ